MDRSGVIDRLATELEHARARDDWETLARSARELAPRLRRIGAAGPWSGAERAALARLRSAHDRAAARVADASTQLQDLLAGIRTNKEGWMAYALAGDTETGTTP